MKIDWAALGNTFGVSLLITLAVVGAFCAGIMALSRKERVSGGAATASLGAAVICFAACAAAVGYGFYMIAQK
ncbi:hypothetical protein [Streptacidiphilus rugosus]|uniref:hypothetical protein n=1 Tax=Streptacidiphilus rugosus TaxID=405783 RepID=UPI00055D6B69|nr:hypothetical protein [Streptacidiphilus rugosus]